MYPKAALPTMLLCFAGCGPGGPEIASMDVARLGWDTLEVSLRFVDRSGMGAERPVRPDSVGLVLFDASYDTLYAGSGTVIAVPDERLQDAEPLLLEVCGRFALRSVCEQRTVFASPKRIRSRVRIEYPADEGFTRGTYELDPGAERQRFAGGEWEAVDGAVVPPLAALVSVERGVGRPLRIPLRHASGTFDLSAADGYRDFRYDLRSSFRDSGEAKVRFDVVAAYANGEAPAGSSTLTVRSRTEEEQLAELSVLVEAAGRDLAPLLVGDRAQGRTLVFVNDWEFDAERGRYVAEIEIHRRRSIFGRWSEAVGTLSVSDDGTDPVFRLLHGSSGVESRWRLLSAGDSLALGRLPDPRPTRRTLPRQRP